MKILKQVQDKANEPIKVWHLIVFMVCVAGFAYYVLLELKREALAVREDVRTEQKVLIDTLKDIGDLFGIPIRDMIKDSIADQKERAGR